MFREKIKSSAIVLLMVNLIFLTGNLWFTNSGSSTRESIIEYVRRIPVVETFFPIEPEYSISKDNLSKPRKFLINDGSLWMAYYNTDIGFSPINERTKDIITGLLKGEITATKKTDRQTWEAGLESLSIYVEYPVAFSPDMFCRIMGTDGENMPKEISAFREFIIIPSIGESDLCVLARDNNSPEEIYAYILKDNYTLPASDLSIYTTTDDSYYQPAFSTGLELATDSNVSLAPLVLFSDSQPATKVLRPQNLIKSSNSKLLENFGFNSEMTPYVDSEGGTNYIANYATAKLFPDGIFEYTAISDERGILLDESGNSFNVLNASIDFAEQTWGCISNEPLSILVSSDLSGYDSSKAYTFKFDYYCNGRPVKIDLPAKYGHKDMNCAIEITVKDGKLISYRQYLRSYKTVADYTLEDNFVTALDYFVQTIDDSTDTPIVIEDIYMAYTDSAALDDLYITWLAKANNGITYRYTRE